MVLEGGLFKRTQFKEGAHTAHGNHRSKTIHRIIIGVCACDPRGAAKLVSAKRLVFFMDAADAFHVGMQWYKVVGRQTINATTRMTKVELIEDSHDFLPAGSIRNGAALMSLATPPLVGHPQQHHVTQSHREAVELRAWSLAV